MSNVEVVRLRLTLLNAVHTTTIWRSMQARCHSLAALIRQERLIVVANIDLNDSGSRRDDLLLLPLLLCA